MMFPIIKASRTRLSLSALSAPLAIGAVLLNFCGVAGAQTLSAPYSSNYSVGFNGSISGVTFPTGGLIFEQNDPNTLLIMGLAANSGGTMAIPKNYRSTFGPLLTPAEAELWSDSSLAAPIYSVPVIRGAGSHITGFGAAVLFATAPNNDGGLVYAPNGDLLFTIYPSKQTRLRYGSRKTGRQHYRSHYGRLRLL